jgi:LemA protein
MLAAIIVIAALPIALFGVFLFFFNRLVRLRNKTDNAWHQIDVQLKRRYDLVPELARVVKGYASHERETLESATAARSQAIGASSVSEQGPAEDYLTGAVGSLLALAERYPDLKANQDFLKFAKELSSTENRIAGARKYYNGALMYYDNARQGFPGNIVAHMFAGTFPDRDYFEIRDPEDRQVPEV